MSTYPKLPLADIEARFEDARRNPSMRSVTAILRITREQIQARGSLGQYPKAAMACGTVSTALLLSLALAPAGLREKLIPVAIGGCFVTALLGYGAVSGARDRRAALAEERELRAMAASALDSVLASPFARKPLDREHRDALREILRSDASPSRLRELLGGEDRSAGRKRSLG